jgi:hypothetical protein
MTKDRYILKSNWNIPIKLQWQLINKRYRIHSNDMDNNIIYPCNSIIH